MGSKSKSSTSNTSKNTNFVNNNYGSEAGSGSALADNINLVESRLTTGNISIQKTDSGAINAGREIAVEGIKANNSTLQKLVSGAYDDLGESREWAGLVTGNAMDGFQRTTEMALQRNAEAIRNSLSFARDSERSDAGLTIETVIPWTVGALVLMAIIYAWSTKK